MKPIVMTVAMVGWGLLGGCSGGYRKAGPWDNGAGRSKRVWQMVTFQVTGMMKTQSGAT